MATTTRTVWIEVTGTAILVWYVQRRKGQRHWAAQFTAQDHTTVEAWVAAQPRLTLVPRPVAGPVGGPTVYDRTTQRIATQALRGRRTRLAADMARLLAQR